MRIWTTDALVEPSWFVITSPPEHWAHSFLSKTHFSVPASLIPESVQFGPVTKHETSLEGSDATFAAIVLVSHVLLNKLANAWQSANELVYIFLVVIF